MHRAEVPVKNEKMGEATFGRPRNDKKSGQAGCSVDLVQKMLGLCEREWDQH